MKVNSTTPMNFQGGFRYQLTNNTKQNLKHLCNGLPDALVYERISKINNKLDIMSDIANIMLKTRFLNDNISVKDVMPMDEIIYLSIEERVAEDGHPYMVTVTDDGQEFVNKTVKTMRRISSVNYELLITDLTAALLNYARNFVEHIDLDGDRLVNNMKVHFQKYDIVVENKKQKVKDWFNE